MSGGAISQCLGRHNCVSRGAGDTVRSTVSLLRCRPGRVTQDLAAGHAGFIKLIVPSIIRPFFTAVTSHVRSRLSHHKCGVVLYGAVRSSTGRHGCLSVLATGGISNVVINDRSISVSCSNVNLPVVSLSHSLTSSVPIIRTSRIRNKRVTTRTFLGRNYGGIIRFMNCSGILSPSTRQRGMFTRRVHSRNIRYFACRLQLGRFRFSSCLRATGVFLSRCPSISNVFTTSLVTLTIRHRTLSQKHHVPSSLFVFNCSNSFICGVTCPPLPAIVRPCRRVTTAVISLLRREVTKRAPRFRSCMVPIISSRDIPSRTSNSSINGCSLVITPHW